MLHGTVTVNKASAYVNEEVVVTAVPDAGYYLVPGTLKANDIPIIDGKFTMPATSVVITASFLPIPAYEITTQVAGRGELIAPDSALADSQVLVETIPAGGYSVKAKSLKVDDEEIEGGSFQMPWKNVVVSVIFEEGGGAGISRVTLDDDFLLFDTGYIQLEDDALCIWPTSTITRVP